MTYRELLHSMPLLKWEAVGVAWLDQDVTVQIDDDEFVPIVGVATSKEGGAADGILDSGHLYFVSANAAETMKREKIWFVDWVVPNKPGIDRMGPMTESEADLELLKCSGSGIKFRVQ